MRAARPSATKKTREIDGGVDGDGRHVLLSLAGYDDHLEHHVDGTTIWCTLKGDRRNNLKKSSLGNLSKAPSPSLRSSVQAGHRPVRDVPGLTRDPSP